MTEHSIDGIPISTIDDVIRQIAEEKRIQLNNPSIREVNIIGNQLHNRLPSLLIIGMDMGIPGLPTPQFIVDAQRASLTPEACAQYTPFDGLPVIKQATSQVVEHLFGLYVNPDYCIPTVGGMHACHEAIGLLGRMNPQRSRLLFLTPGFSVNIAQAVKFGVEYDTLDPDRLYGCDLVNAIERKIEKNNIAGIVWSSPSNPTWRVLSAEELKGIGKLCTQHDVIAIEDNAYLGLDSRRDPQNLLDSVAQHTEYFMLIFSGSKIFNYAGERIGVAVMSEKVAMLTGEGIVKYYRKERFLDAFVQGGVYTTVASVPQSPQRALAAAFNAVATDSFDYFEYDKPYREKAKAVRDVLLKHGFTMPYAKDDLGPIGYGYYFTAAHPAFDDGAKLAMAMLRCGMTAVPLVGFGGNHNEGVRLCTATLTPEQLAKLEPRVQVFSEMYQKK